MVLVRTVQPTSFNLKIRGLVLRHNVHPVKEKIILENVRIAPTTRMARHIRQDV